MDQKGENPGINTKKIPGRSMWDLWWKKWHWDRYFSEYFGFPLPISLHLCSIKMEKQKKTSPSFSSHGCTIKLQAAVRLQHLLRGPSIKK
jgi:hypothetical protein